jgi:hypothetical protein
MTIAVGSDARTVTFGGGGSASITSADGTASMPLTLSCNSGT